MTAKRFYYNVFYHAEDMSRVLEYEIIDRQSYPNYPNHNEKEDIPQWYIYIGENDSNWQDMLVDLLNELHEENYKIKSLLLKKVEELNNAYDKSARAGMPTGGVIGELDSFEEICRIMGWIE